MRTERFRHRRIGARKLVSAAAVLVATACAMSVLSLPARGADPAAGYPARPVRIVIGFTPSGVKPAKDLMITRVLGHPDVHGRLTGLGAEPAPSTPQAFDKFIAEDIATLTRIARAANIRAN